MTISTDQSRQGIPKHVDAAAKPISHARPAAKAKSKEHSAPLLNPMRVCVLNMRGQPLMPCSPSKARHMLNDRKARVLHKNPFTIQLTIGTGESIQGVVLNIDNTGRPISISIPTPHGNGPEEITIGQQRAEPAKRPEPDYPDTPQGRRDRADHENHLLCLRRKAEAKAEAIASGELKDPQIEKLFKLLPITKIVIKKTASDKEQNQKSEN